MNNYPSFYPQNYPQYQNYYQQPVNQQNQVQSSVVWVGSRSEAEAMMDAENEDDGRSYEGRSYEGRSYRGASGRSGRRRDAMGRYSGDYNGMRYMNNYSGRRGYSRDDEMISNLREMMEDAPDEQTRSDLQRMISRMEMM